jgi:hypothetical protein
MKLYIDKENILSLMKSNDSYLVKECMRMVRKNMDVRYNFEKTSDLMKDNAMKVWFLQTAGQGMQNETTFSKTKSDIVPERPLTIENIKSLYHDELPLNHGVFLVNDDEGYKNVSRLNCVIIGSVGHETDIFQELLNLNEDHEKLVTKIKSWSSYCPALPLTDIVLSDNYYFARKWVYEKNDNGIIRALVSGVRNQPVNIVIFAKKPDQNDVGLFDFDDEVCNIRDAIGEETGNYDSKVTIIIVDREMHDRYAISNYYRVKSGAGFQIKNNSVKDDVTADIKSHVNRNSESVSNKLLDNYQELVDDALRFRNNAKSYGDRISNLLVFNH